MSKQNNRLKQALELILDGVAQSVPGEGSAETGRYLMGLVLADNPHSLDAEAVEQIKSIINIADEIEQT